MQQLIQLITYDQVKSKIIEVRKQKVILDSDVAELYGVETKRINEAVKRNLDKFPDGYLLELTSDEWLWVKSQIATSINLEQTVSCNLSKRVKPQFATSPLGGGKVKLPKAFTERGLYMLATILKSPQAVETTLAIIDTFAQIKELTQAVYQFAKAKKDAQKVKIFEESTQIVADLLENKLIVSQHETSFKIKLPFFEITRKITKVKK